ncbi:hypothetical protein B0J12DRAFT_749677 [Macrophomina phaseolina]|uniref:Secreted protein n=1 Tax=Macrophomina phaseolina TaxID=35725 RepID=A0ABQ8GVS2_9PEZI|nr:hypothetical protein B0J12DRAFT_749677 [Macrophomina phaseolina]
MRVSVAAATWVFNQSCFWLLLLERPASGSQLPRVDPAAGRAGGCRYGRAGLSFYPQKQGETCMEERRELGDGQRFDTMDLAISPATLSPEPIEKQRPADLEISGHCTLIHEREAYTTAHDCVCLVRGVWLLDRLARQNRHTHDPGGWWVAVWAGYPISFWL